MGEAEAKVDEEGEEDEGNVVEEAVKVGEEGKEEKTGE